MIRELSGFGWEEQRKTVTANDDVWGRYMEAHPKTPNYRKGWNSLKNSKPSGFHFEGSEAFGLTYNFFLHFRTNMIAHQISLKMDYYGCIDHSVVLFYVMNHKH